MTERKITKSDCQYYRESDGSCLNFTYVGEYDLCTDGDLEHCYEKFPHFFNKKLQEMNDKRFTMCFEQNDINGWTMSIVDWETKEPFNYTTYEVHSSSITDTKDEMEDLCLLLNELNDEVKSQSLVIKEYQNRNEALLEKIARRKFSNRMMRDNIKDYEESIKHLRKSYKKFDEMRLKRIRFLEERLKKNGLSIYVNGAGDV